LRSAYWGDDQVPGAVGLLGIGLMGSALARRLLHAGYQVIGFDVDRGKCAELKKLGGSAVGSVAEVARRCPLYLIAVMTVGQVEDVVEGKDGLLAGSASPSRIALCTSTCEPGRIAALAERAAARGLAFIDAPVSGTSQQVLNGDGFGLIAGDEKAIERAKPVLDVVYPRRRFVGVAGSATKTKLAINHILGLNRVALAEGLVFAESLGLNLHDFLAAARESAAYSQIMDVKGAKMIARDFSPVGKISQHLKDVKTMLGEAARRGQGLPFLELLSEVLEACERHGDSERDNSITIEEIRRRTAA
jgi:3-hydroxyisobutyrate dehydrogenase-like beta-hydroxyacid dehydrogenase